MSIFNYFFPPAPVWPTAIDRKLQLILERLETMAANLTDLDAAIDALPARVEALIEAAVQPIIDAIKAKVPNIDLQAEVDRLNAIGDDVAEKVSADLAIANDVVKPPQPPQEP